MSGPIALHTTWENDGASLDNLKMSSSHKMKPSAILSIRERQNMIDDEDDDNEAKRIMIDDEDDDE